MNDAALLCARLLREGAVRRSDLPDLDRQDVRQEVERRLADVGMTLATSAYSDHVGIRLSHETTTHSAFDPASNLGLHSDACALLVVAWAKLALQKRTVRDRRELPGQGEMFPENRAQSAAAFQPHVRLSTLVREFGKMIGSRTHIKALVSKLRRLGFLAGRGDLIEAGPFLELGLDGDRLVAFIRREVLSKLLEEKKPAEEPGDEEPTDQLLRVIRDLGGEATMKQLIEKTDSKVPRLRKILRELIADRRVTRVGERSQARYRVHQESTPCSVSSNSR